MLPIVVIVLAVGVLVLIGDAVQTKQRAFVAKVPPTACPAPARCTGTLDIIDDHYLVCQPLAFKSYREGDVLFVKEGAGNVAPVQLVSAGDAGVFKARDYEGDTATLSIEAIQGRRCVP